MNNGYFDQSTWVGTASGTLLTIFINIRTADILKTAVLAAVGAVVSFCITVVLKFLIKKIKQYF